MTKTEKTVLFKTLVCLLSTSATDCLDKPDKEIKMAKAEYIIGTIKMIEEMLALEAIAEEEE